MSSLLKTAGSVLKKVALVVFVYAIVIGIFAHYIKKDRPQPSYNALTNQRNEIYKTIKDPQLNKSELGKVGIQIYRSVLCGTAGEACTNNPDDADKNYPHSIIGGMSKVFALPYSNPPASGVYWAYDSLQNAGFVPKTYAAEGIGFSGLRPLIGLWTVFRNIAYMLLVLVLIAIGFMIMFRMKLNPQTVISVENALPKIVVSMILITFSFAIAGFLIDMMYVLMAIGISIISNNNQYYDSAKVQLDYISAEPGRIYLGFFLRKDMGGMSYLAFMGNAILWILGPLQYALRAILTFFTVYLLNMWVHFMAAADPSQATNGITVGIATAVAGIGNLITGITSPFIKVTILVVLIYLGFYVITPFIIGFLVWFTIILLFFRLFFLMLKSYTNIILMIIFSPFFLLMEAVPGSKTGFADWLKNLFAELLVFPLVAVLFNVGYVIANTYVDTSTGASLWAPPFLFGMDAKAFSMLLGIVLVFLIPDFIKQMKEMLGVKGIGLNFGAGTLFGGGAAAVAGGMGLIGQYSSIAMAFPKLREWAGTKIGILGNVPAKTDTIPLAGAQNKTDQQKIAPGTPPAP